MRTVIFDLDVLREKGTGFVHKEIKWLLRDIRRKIAYICLVSNKPRREVLSILEGKKLNDCFEMIAGAEQDTRPEPSMFIRMMHSLHIIPSSVTIFESTHGGLRAAQLSGAGKYFISTPGEMRKKLIDCDF